MKTMKGFRVWQILYPVGIYYVVSSLTYFALEFFMGSEDATYMLRQMVCAAVSIPFTLSFYQQDKKERETVYGKQKLCMDGKQAGILLTCTIAGAVWGLAVNNLLAMTPLMELSTGFQSANAAFFGGELIFELLGSCLVIPFAEELLFRGVVYGRMKLYFGKQAALFGSALLFAVFHVNLVQFLYAFVLGLVLAYLAECTGHLCGAVLGHMAANTVAVVRAHTGWLDFAYQPELPGILVTVALAAVGVLLLWLVTKGTGEKTE